MRRQREGGAGISREKKTSAIREELCLGGRIVAESTSTRIDSDPTNRKLWQPQPPASPSAALSSHLSGSNKAVTSGTRNRDGGGKREDLSMIEKTAALIEQGGKGLMRLNPKTESGAGETERAQLPVKLRVTAEDTKKLRRCLASAAQERMVWQQREGESSERLNTEVLKLSRETKSCEGDTERVKLLMQLRVAAKEIKHLRRSMAPDAQERIAWQQREDDLLLMISRLENRCESLQRTLRAESDAAAAEGNRAKVAEGRFERLLVWGREEERRRRETGKSLAKADEDLSETERTMNKACEEKKGLEAKVKSAEEEACEKNKQLDERRFVLEEALDDLRRRTSENERLEAQKNLMEGEVTALRELANERGQVSNDLREELARLVKETKGISSENVTLRRKFSAEQERWRAAERSGAKQNERRRLEMERQCDDLHTLRYRLQELEARLSSETARRQGAEEDALRSQEMERRSMEELMQSRKVTLPARTGFSHSFPPWHFDNMSTSIAPTAEPVWEPWTNTNQMESFPVTAGAATTKTNDPRHSTIPFPDGFVSTHGIREHISSSPPKEWRQQGPPRSMDDRPAMRTLFRATPVTALTSSPPRPAQTLKPPALSSQGPKGYRQGKTSPTTLKSPPSPGLPSQSLIGLETQRRQRPRPRQAPIEAMDTAEGSNLKRDDCHKVELACSSCRSKEGVAAENWEVSSEDGPRGIEYGDGVVPRFREEAFDVLPL